MTEELFDFDVSGAMDEMIASEDPEAQKALQDLVVGVALLRESVPHLRTIIDMGVAVGGHKDVTLLTAFAKIFAETSSFYALVVSGGDFVPDQASLMAAFMVLCRKLAPKKATKVD